MNWKDWCGLSPRIRGSQIGYLGALFLGVVLSIGGLTKVVDPQAFAEQIRIEGLDFAFPADVVALIGLGLELGLGTALVLGIRRLWIMIPAGALVALFLVLTGRSYWNFSHGIVDESLSCGCFGNLVDRTPAEAFWQDLFLMVPALLVAFLIRPETPFPVKRVGLTAAVILGSVSFAWKAPELPLDDLATQLKPGKVAREICSGSEENRLCLTDLVPGIEEGMHIVVLADLSSPEFGAAVEDLNEYTLSGQGPTLWVLSSSPPEEHRLFFWQWGPAFQILEAPRSLLRPLYRSLPRSFLLSNGTVIRTFSGLVQMDSLAKVRVRNGISRAPFV